MEGSEATPIRATRILAGLPGAIGSTTSRPTVGVRVHDRNEGYRDEVSSENPH
jgi:hypothetical protein